MGIGIRRRLRYVAGSIEALFTRVRPVPDLQKILHSTHARDETDWFSGTKKGIGPFFNISLEKLEVEADDVMNHHFTVLGTDKIFRGAPIHWNLDTKSSETWPVLYYKRIKSRRHTNLRGIDIKILWELSRFQHLIPLIKSYLLTRKEMYSKEAVDQINHWMKMNPPYYDVNWTCAMEVAIRVCNWMWAWWVLRDTPVWMEEFNIRFMKSIWQHGWYIEHNFENKGGIRTNHYLADIVGLLFIGIMFPQFRDSEKWKNFGLRELIRCLDEMVYTDGVSFENSTGYHRLAMELFTYSAILCKKNDMSLPKPFWQRLEKIFEFVLHCMRPDGRIPMIGDADDGRFFILSNYYDWDRWDFRYLLSIGAVLFRRSDFKLAAGKLHEEVCWLFGKEGLEQYDRL